MFKKGFIVTMISLLICISCSAASAATEQSKIKVDFYSDTYVTWETGAQKQYGLSDFAWISTKENRATIASELYLECKKLDNATAKKAWKAIEQAVSNNAICVAVNEKNDFCVFFGGDDITVVLAPFFGINNYDYATGHLEVDQAAAALYAIKKNSKEKIVDHVLKGCHYPTAYHVSAEEFMQRVNQINATPTAKPTATPTARPTATPTAKPTATPTAKPTATPTVKPTATPTATPMATALAELADGQTNMSQNAGNQTKISSEMDLSTLSFDELVYLKDQINLAMWESSTWQEVTVPQGIWKVGEEIPAGHWTISASNGSSAYIRIGTALESNQKEIDFSKSTISYGAPLKSEDAHGYNKVEDVTGIDFELADGMYIEIKYSSVVFSPYSGKPSFGFK